MSHASPHPSRSRAARCRPAALVALCALVLLGGAVRALPAGAASPAPPPGIPAAPDPADPRDAGDGDGDAGRTAGWQKAVDEAEAPHLDDVLEPRPLAAVIGLAWFGLAIRSRWRGRRRGARTG